jgi:hypothetical protein
VSRSPVERIDDIVAAMELARLRAALRPGT